MVLVAVSLNLSWNDGAQTTLTMMFMEEHQPDDIRHTDVAQTPSKFMKFWPLLKKLSVIVKVHEQKSDCVIPHRSK